MLVWEDDVRPSSTKSSNGTAPLAQSAARAAPPSPLPLQSQAVEQPTLQLQSVVASPVLAAAVTHAKSLAKSVADVDTRRVNVAEKRIINGQTDVNQLVPFK